MKDHLISKNWVGHQTIFKFDPGKETQLAATIHSSNRQMLPGIAWQGLKEDIHFNENEMRKCLLDLEKGLWAIGEGSQFGLATAGQACLEKTGLPLLGYASSMSVETLGDQSFCDTYGTQAAFYAGAMANGISSEKLVIALGQAGFLGVYGAGGMPLGQIEAAIQAIQAALPAGPYAFNLLNNPNEPVMEERAVELYLSHGVRVIEASAYVALNGPLVHFRAAGLKRGPAGEVEIGNRIIAKLSRLEMAKRFLEPAPEDLLKELVAQNKITPEQAQLARQVPMADDITVEADSGGHTDNRPMVCMIPAFIDLRDQIQTQYNYAQIVRVGAAGGIGTPEAALAAFMLGAAYVVTGSVNQACVESGASEHTRGLLAQMDMADVSMAPAGDMFEMGVKVQVLKRGTMFPMRAQKLYELYTRYNAWDEIPLSEREKLEKTVFKRDFNSIWADTEKFFMERDPRQVERGNANPKDKMALVFRWYLGLSSRWSAKGEKGREMDYQIWSGPSMGAFNKWVKGTYLEEAADRHVVDVSRHILRGCAYLYRVRALEANGLNFPASLQKYIPESL